MPITWKNITSRDSNASASLAGASELFKNAGNAFNKLIDDRRALQQRNTETRGKNAMDRIYDSLAQYKTPEEFKAAQQSGVISELLSNAGPYVDRDKLRTLEKDTLNKLRDSVSKEQAYQQDKFRQENTGTINDIMAQAAMGQGKLPDLLEMLPDNHPDKVKLTQETTKLYDSAITRQTQNELTRHKETASEIATKAMQIGKSPAHTLKVFNVLAKEHALPTDVTSTALANLKNQIAGITAPTEMEAEQARSEQDILGKETARARQAAEAQAANLHNERDRYAYFTRDDEVLTDDALVESITSKEGLDVTDVDLNTNRFGNWTATVSEVLFGDDHKIQDTLKTELKQLEGISVPIGTDASGKPIKRSLNEVIDKNRLLLAAAKMSIDRDGELHSALLKKNIKRLIKDAPKSYEKYMQLDNELSTVNEALQSMDVAHSIAKNADNEARIRRRWTNRQY